MLPWILRVIVGGFFGKNRLDSLLLAFPIRLSRSAFRFVWWLHKYFGAGKLVECDKQERHLQRLHSIVGSHFAFDEEETSQGNTTIGHVEFKAFLSELEGPIKSPYRQGHYIYTVIRGGQKEY